MSYSLYHMTLSSAVESIHITMAHLSKTSCKTIRLHTPPSMHVQSQESLLSSTCGTYFVPSQKLRPWLVYPELHYTSPELHLDTKGKLVYSCQWMTKGFDITPYIFWDFDKEEEPKRQTLALQPANSTIAGEKSMSR